MLLAVIFFFKQKTAYEMRISDWSSDVCASDLSEVKPVTIQAVSLDWKWLFIYPEQGIATVNEIAFPKDTPVNFQITSDSVMNSFFKIGRASCRERVCQYV